MKSKNIVFFLTLLCALLISNNIIYAHEYLAIGFTNCINNGYDTHNWQNHYQDIKFYSGGVGVGYGRQYAGHNCTNYAAYMLSLVGKEPTSSPGNAEQWDDSYRNWGYLVDGNPAVGSIAQWNSNHVAYVERVEPSYILISEDNWGGDYDWRKITRGTSDWPNNFIHVKDTVISKPTSPAISITKSVINVGENVTLNVSSNGATNYYIGIDKDSTRIDTPSLGSGTSYTRSFSETGNYSAYVTAANSAGSVDSARIYFSIVKKPSQPTLSVASLTPTTSSVIFNWNSCQDATGYDLRIIKEGESVPIKTEYNIKTLKWAERLSPGKYTAYLCSVNNKFVDCWTRGNDVSFEVKPSDLIPKKIVSSGNKIYALFDDANSWTIAKSICEKIGGKLMSVNSTSELDIVKNLLPFGTRSFYWLGANDVTTEGKFVWDTGELFSISNWSIGEPNNSSDEDYLMVYKSSDANLNTKWNDSNNFNENTGFICEINIPNTPAGIITTNGHRYEIYDFSSLWQISDLIAKVKGGHLTTITTSAENETVKSLLSYGKSDYYFLGASDAQTEGSFKWVTGESFTFSNWGQSQPDNWQLNENYLMMYKTQTTLGTWNDIASYSFDRLSMGFILEISNSVVSFNTLGGSAVASKTLTIGSLITTPSAPTRSGYVFSGWFKESSYINSWNFATDKVAGNITLYAKWMPIAISGQKVVSGGFDRSVISWTAVSGAKGYEVNRSTSSAGAYSLIGTVTSGTTTSYTNTGLSFNTTYYYKVRAYSLNGTTKVYGSFSGVVSAKTILSTPISLVASSATYNSIKLTWGTVSGASGYTVYRATLAAGTYTALTSVTTPYYTNISLPPGATYYYKVAAYRLVGTTKVYGAQSIYVGKLITPPTINNVSVSQLSSTSVKLSWVGIVGVNGYEVYRSSSSTGTYTLLKTTTYTNFTDSSLTIQYYYKVRSYRLSGSTKIYSAFSPVCTFPKLSEWVTSLPSNVTSTTHYIESKTQYAFRDKEFTETTNSALGNGWIVYNTAWNSSPYESSEYSYAQFPGGFNTSNSIYSTYNRQPMISGETTNIKTVVNSGVNTGQYIYWHWCNYYAYGPINRAICDYYTSYYSSFHAFVGEYKSYDAVAMAYNYSNKDACPGTYWWFQIPIYKCTYSLYNKVYFYYRWYPYSAWQDSVIATNTNREVISRVVYRYSTK